MRCWIYCRDPGINFDQEKFEQLRSGGSKSPLHVRKYRKASVAIAHLATSSKQAFVETTEVPYEPNTASRVAKPAPCEPKQASREAKQPPCEPKQVPREPK